MIAQDDLVRTHAEAQDNAREPLLVLEPLIEFLDAHQLGSGEPEIEPIGEGHSNVTYSVRRGDMEFVLRRPPRGPLPPSAHDVLREARIVKALEGRGRVAKVLAVCDNPSLIGAPFYLMQKVAGHVIGSTVPPQLDCVEDRRLMCEQLVDALVEIHAVDWREAGLEGFGKPTGYLERQLRRFSGLWELNRTRDLPAVEQIGRWLADTMPESPAATIVHGDFRLGNAMFAPQSPAHLVAVFDWEMATIGDPLADVGYLCTFWADRDDPPLGVFDMNAVTREAGFMQRSELLERYEEKSGRSMTDIVWYRTLAVWKIIVFMEGNYKRSLAGTTDDEFLRVFGEGIAELAERVEREIHRD